jgi:hypothetical protein
MVYNRTMPKRLRKMPRDINELAKAIVDLTTGDREPEELPEKNPHAVALGKLGGSKGGTQRAKNLSATKRKQIARKAAKARWTKRA